MKVSHFLSSFLAPILAHTMVIDYPTQVTSRIAHAGLQIAYPHPGTIHIPTDGPPTTYSYNWAGAVMKPPAPNETYTSVYGQVTIPVPSLPPNATIGETYQAAIWVGIDGTIVNKVIWQAGFYVKIRKSPTGNSVIEYQPWFEWLPEAGRDIPLASFPLQGGDVISLNLTARSPTSGTAVFENLTKGRQFVVDMTVPNDEKYRLGGKSAEWIVEDFNINGKMVPFVDFNNVKFTKCLTNTNRRKGLGVDGARRHVIIVGDSNKPLTNVTISGGSEVEIEYTPVA